VTLSSDGRAAAAEYKGKIVLWDAATGKERKTLKAPEGDLGVYLKLSNDGHTLAVWTHESLAFHDLKEDRVRRIRFPAPFVEQPRFQGSFSPDGKYLSLGVSDGGGLCLYEVATRKELRIACHGSAFAPDGKTLIVSSMRNDAGEIEPSICAYEVATGKEVTRVTKGIPGHYETLNFAPDGKTMVCGGGKTPCVMDARTFEVLRVLEGHVPSPRFTLDGKKVISPNGARLCAWDPSTGREIDGSEGNFGDSPAIAISPDGRVLAAGGWDDKVNAPDKVCLWELKTGKLARTLTLRRERASGIAFSADGKALITPQVKGFIQTWDVATGKEVGSTELDNPGRLAPFLQYYSFRSSPDRNRGWTVDQMSRKGKWVTSLSSWDMKTGKRLTERILPREAHRLARRPDVSAAALPLTGGLTLLDVRTGEAIWRTADAVRGPINASPDFRLIVVGKTKTTVGVWESATGKEVATIDVGTFDHVALASDDRSLVATDAARVRVVDLFSRKEVLSRPLPVVMRTTWGETFVTNLTLTLDGRRAFTAQADGTGLVWDIAWKRPTRIASDKDLATLWADLGSPDAGRAWRAVWALADAQADAFLEDRLRAPGPDAPPKKLLDALDADGFGERERAEKSLVEMGVGIVPALRLARDKATSAEQRRRLDRLIGRHGPHTPDELRRLRAAGVLDAIGRGKR
jgi:WD40 repeat protein